MATSFSGGGSQSTRREPPTMGKQLSAIKAKLVELGAYVDDELPDYIMVMVANKKTEAQMTEDLSLFLGHHTNKFTSWLHGLLVKLQTLSSDQQKTKSNLVEENTIPDKAVLSDKKSSPDKSQIKIAKSPENDVKTAAAKKTNLKRKSSESKGKIGNKVTGKEALEKSEHFEASQDVSSKAVVNIKQKDEEYVSELLETVEVDEFSEEFMKEQEQNQTRSVAKAVKNVAANTAMAKKDVQQTQTVVPQETRDTIIATRDLSYAQKKRVVSKKGKTLVKKKTDFGMSKPGVSASAKKKKPTSVVGTIKQKYTELPLDEEYDPLNPSFGKVASAVKVSRKRLNVPPSQQANKALIMKATAEAEKSVNSTLRHVLKEEKLYSAREQATVRPMQRNQPELRHPRIRPNIELISKSKREEMMRKLKYNVENEESQESDEPQDMKIVIQNKLKSPNILQHTQPGKLTYTVTNNANIVKQEVISEEMLYHVTNKPQNIQYVTSPEPVQYTVSNVPQTVQVVSSVPTGFVTSNQPVQYFTRLPGGQVAYADAKEPQFIQYVKVEPQQMDTAHTSLPTDTRRIQHVATVHPVMDNRLVKRKSADENEEEMEKVEVEEEEMTEEEEEMLPDIVYTDETSNEEEMLAVSPDSEILQVEDDSLGLEEEKGKTMENRPEPPEAEVMVEHVQQKRVIKEKMSQQKKTKQPHINTKFIVTLDGVDPTSFKTDDTFTKDEMEAGNSKPVKHVPVVSKCTPAVITPIKTPAITPITFSLNDTDDEDEETEESPSKKSKMLEKCKFWPACVNGNSCSFHHPTVSCKMFPGCKFGDKCLYIHPNCKFDAKCTKKDCPFTHASKRGTGPTVIKQYIPMPVPPAPSYHHRPPTKTVCRFAEKCHNVYCQYQHPANCRYGANCINRASCPFSHPQSQTKDKYSWTANTSLDHRTTMEATDTITKHS